MLHNDLGKLQMMLPESKRVTVNNRCQIGNMGYGMILVETDLMVQGCSEEMNQGNL